MDRNRDAGGRDERQGHHGNQRRTSTVAETQDSRYGNGGGGDVGRQHMRCGTTEIAKWVGRTAIDWEISTGNDY